MQLLSLVLFSFVSVLGLYQAFDAIITTVVPNLIALFHFIKRREYLGYSALNARIAVRNYLLYLEERGDRLEGLYEKCLFYVYTKVFSPEQRELDKSDVHKLPAWMESVIRLYTNRYTFWTVVLIVLYCLCIFGSHLWLPLFVRLEQQPVILQLQEDVKHATGVVLYHCPLTMNATTGHCFVRASLNGDTVSPSVEHTLLIDNLGKEREEEESAKITLTKSIPESPASTPKAFFSFVDKEFRLYYQFNMLQRNEANKQHISPIYVTDDVLFDQLRQIQEAENTRLSAKTGGGGQVTKKQTNPCICPAFLDILDDVVFFFDRTLQRWLVLDRPVIFRNNTLSDLVSSMVNYAEISQFYKKNKALQDYLALGEVVHHDAFIVEYTEYLPPKLPHSNVLITEDLKELKELNHRLAEFYKLDLNAKKPKAFLLYKNQEYERKKIQLIEEDAICYIYCTTMNTKLTS